MDASAPTEAGKLLVGWQVDQQQLEAHCQAMIEKHTQGLRPGWYVTTGFFWHDDMGWVAGPFTTQDDAMTCRVAIEKSEGHHQYYIDQVEPPAARGGDHE